MEGKIFGKPITNSTLEGMPEYTGKTITRMDRARAALNMKNADGKEDAARKYLDNLQASVPNLIAIAPAAFAAAGNIANAVAKKKSHDNLQDIHIAVFIHNATGDPIRLVDKHVWKGSALNAVGKIENGQVAAFVHTGKLHGGASAALVYRAENAKECESDWMLSWFTLDTPTNKGHTEIREPDYFQGKVWDELHQKLKEKQKIGPGLHDRQRGLLASVCIGPGTKPQYVAFITLDGL